MLMVEVYYVSFAYIFTHQRVYHTSPIYYLWDEIVSYDAMCNDLLSIYITPNKQHKIVVHFKAFENKTSEIRGQCVWKMIRETIEENDIN